MKKFIFIFYVFFILAACSTQTENVERVVTKPLFPKYTGKFPAILNVYPDGKKLSVNIGNPYKATFRIVLLNQEFQIMSINSYNIIEVPGIHKIDFWKPSGDYLLYSFDNKNANAICCYDSNYDEIKLYNPKKIKIIDNTIFFGEFIKYNNKNKLYLACIINNTDTYKRLKIAGKKFYENKQ